MPTQISDNETNVMQLWAGFRRKKNEYFFWAQYEQAKHLQQTKITENEVSIPFVFMLGIVLLFEGIATHEGIMSVLTITIGLIAIYTSGYLFWQLKTLEIDSDGLTIYHGVFVHKKHFRWATIKHAYELNAHQTQLVISTYKNKRYHFPYQLSTHNKRAFYISLKARLNK